MMQPRCAVCDGDKQLETYCDAHARFGALRDDIQRGVRSDWPCNTGGRVNHAEMMTGVAWEARHGKGRAA